MIYALLVPLMAVLGRLSGMGKIGPIPSWVPELAFSGVIALCACVHSWWMILTWPLVFAAMQSGHGTVYNMRGWESSDPGRKQTLEYVVRPIFDLFLWSIYQPGYSWAVMGLKGFLIGLPLFPFGLLLAILWPAAYAVRGPVWGEWLAGGSAGVCCLLLVAVV